MGQSRPAQHRQAHEGAVTAVVPTPDGLYLLTAGTDSRIRLWDLQDNRSARTVCPHDSSCRGLGTLTPVLNWLCIFCSNTLVNYPSPFNRSKKVRSALLNLAYVDRP